MRLIYSSMHKRHSTNATNCCFFCTTKTSPPLRALRGPTPEQLHSLVQDKVQVKSSVAGRSHFPPAVRLCGAAGRQEGHQHGHLHSEQDQPAAAAAAAAAAGHRHQLCTTAAQERVNIHKDRRGRRKKHSPGGSFFIHSHSSVMLPTMAAICSLLPGPLGRLLGADVCWQRWRKRRRREAEESHSLSHSLSFSITQGCRDLFF